MRKGLLIAVSGFSGAGKGTIMKELLARHSEYALSVSATTRKARVGEREGVEYFFKTEDEFQDLIDRDALIEHAGYADHQYGTPKAYVEEMREKGFDVLLEIEVQGALSVKERYPETLLIFVSAPSVAEIRRRLTTRGTETPEEIEKRIAQIEREMKSIPRYDYLLINETIEESVERIHSIISANHHKVSNNLDFIAGLEEEISGGKQ